MAIIVSLIHGTPAAMPPMIDAMRGVRGIDVLNQLDEALLAGIAAEGALTSKYVRRMERQISLAIDAGSEVVITTCNAYSSAVIHTLRPRFRNVNLFAVDEPMIRRAVEYDRVAMIATNAEGLQSQQSLLSSAASAEGRTVEVTSALRTDAFDALAAGDHQEHDRIVLAELRRLGEDFPLILLAQASMARLMDAIPEDLEGRVLSSPRSAAQEVSQILQRRVT